MQIQVENLVKTFTMGGKEFKALNKVSFEVAKGEIVTILGPSGSGKSTLLNVLGGIERADGGKLLVEGTDVTSLSDQELTQYRRSKIGFVFQFYNLIPNLTVAENLEVAANIAANPLPLKEILAAVGMAEQNT